MTMLARPFPGRLPLSPVLLAFALVLAAPLPASVARAEDPQAISIADEAAVARAELDGTIARMTTASRHVRAILREARKRGVVREIACADNALSRADVAHRMARVHAAEAASAYARGDVGFARASRARVLELEEAQRTAYRAAMACRPAPVERVVAGTVVRVVVDPAIPDVTPELPSR